MAKAKVAKELKEIFWIVDGNGAKQDEAKTFSEAETKAVDLLETNEGDEYHIIKIVECWSVSWPPEPSPEIHVDCLENLP